MMKKNILTKALATGLAATMVFGSTLVAFADDNAGSLEGNVTLDGLVDLDVVSVEVPTSTFAGFGFTLDPQGLIRKSIASGKVKDDSITQYAYPNDATMYFLNKNGGGEIPATAKEYSIGGVTTGLTITTTTLNKENATYKFVADSVTPASAETGYKIGVSSATTGYTVTLDPTSSSAAGVYIYRTTEDKWSKDGDDDTAYTANGFYLKSEVTTNETTGSTHSTEATKLVGTVTAVKDSDSSDVTWAKNDEITVVAKGSGEDGWIKSDDTTNKIQVGTASAFTIKDAEDNAKTPAANDTIKMDGYHEAGTTDAYSNTSDKLIVTNKSFVPVNVELTASMSGLGDKVKMSSATGDDWTAINDPVVKLAVVGKKGELADNNAGVKTTYIASGKDTAFVFDTVTENDFDDFGVGYNNTNKVYEVEELTTPFSTYEFKLTGETNTKGWVKDVLSGTTPKVNVTWAFTKNSAYTATLSAAGVAEISGLPTDESVNLAELELVSADAGSKKLSKYAGTFTKVDSRADDGKITVTLGNAWKEVFSQAATTMVVTLTDGTTIVTTTTMAAYTP